MPKGVYPRTNEHNAKLSAIHKALWQDPEYRERQSIINKGKHPTAETRAKLSTIHKLHWQNPTYRAKVIASNTGKKRSDEARAKISAGRKGKHLTTEAKAKISAAQLGKSLTDEHKAKISAAQSGGNNPFFGKHHSKEARNKIGLASARLKGPQNPMYGKHLSEETKARIGIASKEQWKNPEYRARQSASHKKLWQDSQYVQMIRRAQHWSPNKSELKLQDILDRCYPNTWKYVGDGQITIGGRIPDFININGRKRIIELFGAHWHPIFDISDVKCHYHQYGFEVAVIWEDELKDENRLLKVFKEKFR